MDVKNDILWRVYLSYLLVVVVALVIFGKAAYIQQVQGAYWRGLSDSLHQKMDSIESERGTIYSEDGQMLSTSVPRFDIYWDTRLATLRNNNDQLYREKIDSVCEAMAGLFKDMTAGEYKVMMQQAYHNRDGYFLLKKKISFREYEQLRAFPLFKLGRYTSGMIAVQKNFRLNPYQMLAFRTIGLARDSNQVGLENAYDSVLQGKAGKQLVRFIAGGVKIPVEDDQYVVEPETGRDIISTLDVFIQGVTEKALMNAMVKHEAEQGCAIVMETATGKIKAMANLGKMEDGSYWEKYNYAITASEPGSTFKLATLLALLEDKKVTLQDVINVEGGKWQLNNQTVYDAEVHGIQMETVQETFEKSSNVGMAKMVWTNYGSQPNRYIQWLEKMHLDSPMGIDLTGERLPEIHRPGQKIWNVNTLPWMAFGYNLKITPLQTLCLYNAIANGGKMMKPYLVSAISEEGTIIRSMQPSVLIEKICSESTLRQLNTCLQGVCIRGTAAKVFKNSSYSVAGKTGTAQVANGNKGYTTNMFQASFAGFFPADHPKYTCVVVIKNKPGAILHHGSDVAAPVFKEIADRLYATYLRQQPASLLVSTASADSIRWSLAGNKNDLQLVAKSLRISINDSSRIFDQWATLNGSLQNANLTPRTQNPGVMPELVGLGLKDALLLGESSGLQIKISGKGRVVSQSVPPGETVQKKQVIQIQLSENKIGTR
ncbi:MAG: PASTA domain-containing protein [Sediminibacterium sp.]|nr:PASTA domain-containing protein [Sediminibacterium sp.]